MKLIDTHIHVWNLDKVEYPWLKGDRTILNQNYDLGGLEPARHAAGVTGGVLVQAANSLEDTEWMLRTAEANGWIEGVVGWVPLMDPAATARVLGSWDSRLKGVRHLIHDEADPGWLLQEPVLESLGLLAARGIPYDVVGVIPEHIRTALKVAERWPELRMVFDHLNQPPEEIPGSSWEGLMVEASKHPNFYVKISGLGRLKDLEPCIEFALRYFGDDRCLCGGDWPVSLLAGSYERIWAAYRSVIGKYLNEEEKERVFYKNAESFYGII